MTFTSNWFWNFPDMSEENLTCNKWGAGAPAADLLDYIFGNCNGLNAGNKRTVDPDLVSYPPTKGTGAACRTLQSYTLCPRPSLTSPVHEDNGAVLDPLTRPADGQAYPGEGPTDLDSPSWYAKVPYAGAFDPYEPSLWTDCWTILDFAGYTGCPMSVQVIDQAYIDANQPLTLTNDKEYHLYGRVHIKSGQELYVEEGVVFKGEGPSSTLHPTEPSALIIDRGGYAEIIGTPDNPIIMTYLFDNVEDPYDMPHGNASRGLWGGLIILGYANIGVCDQVPGESERHVEGIPNTDWDYDNVIYGCSGPDCDDEDNSGIYQYISILHGGHEIGEANEINGLTMGAVGAGTTIDHIEVYHNLDDGFEWFGGTVNTRYLVSAFNGDDAFDYDQGFRGYGQFWFAILDDDGDNAGEHDGNEDPEDACPFARPDITNATYIGPGEGASGAANAQVLKIRDNAGAHYSNSIFIDFPLKGLSIEDLDPPANPCGVPGGIEDSEKRLAAGDLTFTSMFFWNFAGLTTDGCANVPADRAIISGSQTWIEQYVFDNCNTMNANNCIADPQICSYPPTKGIGNPCRQLAAGSLNPRLALTSPAIEDNGAQLDALGRQPDGSAYPGDNNDLSKPDWFKKVGFAGAFSPWQPLWTDKWTFLHFGGYTCDCVCDHQPYIPGDADGSGGVDIDDVVFLINYIFGGGPTPSPLISGDADCSGGIDIDDVVFLINYIFGGGPEPEFCDVI
jgi:hypothetical protein